MIYIGIDPGTHTGFAVWDSGEGRFLSLETLRIHQAMAEVTALSYKYDGDLMVIFEDARQRTWIPKEKSVSEWKGKVMGAGSVKRDCSIWEDFCQDKGIPFQAQPPIKGATKVSADHFKMLTGWTKRTSEHARDAAMLVIGK